ncbi:MAG: isoprenylcysteine carboxylmethyltransferase family protein [Candidatus Thiodiazotropha sp.]|jgi:protein-S-isoprenylcysteine O-methyltransferase Ste14
MTGSIKAASWLFTAQKSGPLDIEERDTMNRDATVLKTDRFPLRLYPPIWFLLFAAMALVLAWLWPLSIALPSFIHNFSFLLAASGGVLALWAALLFRRRQTTAHPYAVASALVTGGPYRISRNPMYLGLLLTLIAMGLWLQSLSALLLTPLFVFVINRCNILPEERRLTDQFGEPYKAYLSQTRRWI